MIEFGSYAAYYTIRGFLGKTQEAFIKSLKNNFPRVSPFALEEEQIAAWKDCFNVLQESLSDLPMSYRNLNIVFEYVLPNNKPGTKKAQEGTPIRADVILVSNDTVLVLEFKQRDEKDLFKGLASQANKYKTRLENYHNKSKNMDINALLVLTKANDYRGEVEEVPCCSPDRLSDEIIHLMGNFPKPYPRFGDWINSKFVPDNSALDDSEYEEDVDVDDRDLSVEELLDRYEPGSIVKHNAFGLGEVIDLSEDGKEYIITVRFNQMTSHFFFLECIKKKLIWKMREK